MPDVEISVDPQGKVYMGAKDVSGWPRVAFQMYFQQNNVVRVDFFCPKTVKVRRFPESGKYHPADWLSTLERLGL